MRMTDEQISELKGQGDLTYTERELLDTIDALQAESYARVADADRALQIAVAEARCDELDRMEIITDEDGVLAEFGSVAHLHYKNNRRFELQWAVEEARKKVGR